MDDGCRPFVPALVDAVDDDAHRPVRVCFKKNNHHPDPGRRTHGRGDRRTRVVLGATHAFDGTTRSEIAGERYIRWCRQNHHTHATGGIRDRDEDDRERVALVNDEIARD
jgi:hypothetical protein